MIRKAYSNTARHSLVANSDDHDLQDQDKSNDADEPSGSANVFENIDLVFNLPGVNEVVDLKEHEEVENDRHMS